MRIGYATASLSPRGGGVYDAVVNLAVQVSRHNARVLVFGLKDVDTAADTSARGLISMHAAKPVGPAAFGYAPELNAAIWSAAPDLVHVHGLWMYPSVASRSWSRRSCRPHLISPHGMLDMWALRNSAWKKKLAGWLYENRHLRSAACLHALNDSEAASVRAYGLPNPICIVPNGVELPAQRAHIGAVGKRVCVFLGRLHPKKGLRTLIRAWARVSAREWTLLIAGWDQGGHERELQELAASLSLGDCVKFVGPKFGADKSALLQCASAFVLPSLSEGLPVAVLEAWAYGLPVAMTPECNLPEGFLSGAAVRMDATEDGVAAGLRALFDMQDGELRAIGQRGRQLVEERFTWPRVAGEMIKVYAWVLGRGPMPECVKLT